MKKYTVLFVSFLLVFSLLVFSAPAAFAQQGGFTGPQVFAGQQVAFSGQAGFMGPSMNVTVAQVVQTFPNKAQAILRGNIVQYLGGDMYLFRDSSGDVIIKIKNDRWWGLSVGVNDLVEIGGELKREKNGWMKYFDAKNIRMAQ